MSGALQAPVRGLESHPRLSIVHSTSAYNKCISVRLCQYSCTAAPVSWLKPRKRGTKAPNDAAAWMAEKLRRGRVLYQDDAAYGIQQQFGDQIVIHLGEKAAERGLRTLFRDLGVEKIKCSDSFQISRAGSMRAGAGKPPSGPPARNKYHENQKKIVNGDGPPGPCT